MATQNSNNWLQPFRDQCGHTQESLALDISVHVKKLQRWEQYDDKGGEVPYTQLAKILDVAESDLINAHENGLSQHAISQSKKQPVNKALIIKALTDCGAMGLAAEILFQLNVETIDEAAELIVMWLQKGEKRPFTQHFNQLIKTKIETTDFSSIKDLDLIEQLIGYIALSVTIPHDFEQLDNAQTFNILGVEKAWSIRLMIDASIGFSMTGITAISSTELASVGGVKIQESTKDKVWQAAHEIIKNLDDELFMEKKPFPELVKSEGHDELPENEQYPEFSKYCKERINRAIEQTNYEQKHCFLYSLQQEPIEVQQRVLMLLESIRIFICSKNNSGSLILRLDEGWLEGWIANLLDAIQKRRIEMTQTKLVEENTMKPENSTESHVTVNTIIESSGVNIAGNNSTANQLNQTSESEQLIKLLNDILKETDRTIPEHQQLRGDINDILNPLNNNEQPPEQGKSWLQDGLKKLKTLANLKTGTSLITLVEKAVKLYEKI